MKKRILVIGATGLLGEPVAVRLRQDGFVLRLMARNGEKAARRFGDGFEVTEGDVHHIPSIEKTMDGCFGVHINLSGEAEGPGVANITSVASRQHIQRLTYVSGTSVAEGNTWVPLIRRKFLAERAIRHSGVGYCIFCPTWFTEILRKYVRGRRAFVFGRQPNPYHLVAADDFARMVAASYGIEEARNKRFIIHGPEGILFHDAVWRYCSVFHPEVKKVSTMPYWVATLIASTKGPREMKRASEFMAAFEKIGERGDPSEANSVLGAPTTTLDEWLQQNRH